MRYKYLLRFEPAFFCSSLAKMKPMNQHGYATPGQRLEPKFKFVVEKCMFFFCKCMCCFCSCTYMQKYMDRCIAWGEKIACCFCLLFVCLFCLFVLFVVVFVFVCFLSVVCFLFCSRKSATRMTASVLKQDSNI